MTRMERLGGRHRSPETGKSPEDELKETWPKWGRGSSHMGEPREPRKLFGGVPPGVKITMPSDAEAPDMPELMEEQTTPTTRQPPKSPPKSSATSKRPPR